MFTITKKTALIHNQMCGQQTVQRSRIWKREKKVDFKQISSSRYLPDIISKKREPKINLVR